MPIKNGDAVLIINHDLYQDKAAKVVDIKEDLVSLKLWDGSAELTLKLEDVKRKKSCVCGMTKSMPFCDGSHAG